jgi:hypothetical protein
MNENKTEVFNETEDTWDLREGLAKFAEAFKKAPYLYGFENDEFENDENDRRWDESFAARTKRAEAAAHVKNSNQDKNIDRTHTR